MSKGNEILKQLSFVMVKFNTAYRLTPGVLASPIHTRWYSIRCRTGEALLASGITLVVRRESSSSTWNCVPPSKISKGVVGWETSLKPPDELPLVSGSDRVSNWSDERWKLTSLGVRLGEAWKQDEWSPCTALVKRNRWMDEAGWSHACAELVVLEWSC